MCVRGGIWAECSLQITECFKEMQKTLLWARMVPEVSTLPSLALAFSSRPLWTVHCHILEEPPKHKRIDGENVLEIFCYTISYGLGTSRLAIAGSFLEDIFF